MTAPAPTQYWLVVTADELLALLVNEVKPSIRKQAQRLLHREPWETTEAYRARLDDLTTQRVRAQRRKIERRAV